jgi:hypothetical protein
LRIPRPLHRAVLRVLRPAESAVRRLIVIAARGLVVKPAATPRPRPKGPIKRGERRRMAFPLFDKRKRFAPFDRKPGRRVVPRVWTIGPEDPTVAALWAYQRSLLPPPAKPPDDGLIDGRRLAMRLDAIKRVLADLPGQARRLVRLRARRQTVPKLAMQSPMRPGRPPGYRRKPSHEVDEVLAECHALARDVERLDSS